MDATFFVPVLLIAALLFGLILLARSARIVNQYEKGNRHAAGKISRPGAIRPGDHHAADGQRAGD